MMDKMPPMLVAQYNELFMQLGWILFFSMTFPAGALFCIVAGFIRMKIELRGMSEYKQKNEPQPQKDIGIWMDLLEFVSNLGIVVCVYIVIFTSKMLNKNAPYEEHVMYIITFIALHIIFLIKYILAGVIDDEPAWVSQDAEKVANRVEQVDKDNKDKKLIEYMSSYFSDVDLLFEVLKLQHKDLNKSG